MTTSVHMPSAADLPATLIDALFQPAAGPRLDPSAFAAAEVACQAAARVLGCAVTLGPRSSERRASTHVAEFGARLTCGVELTLSLDLAACRALVDTLEHSHAGLRGVGPLTPTEEGALEYLLLACLDELTTLAPGAAALALLTVESGAELRQELARSDAVAFEFALQVGHAVGCVSLWLPKSSAASSATFARSKLAPRTHLDVACALDLLEIPEAELDSLAAGDVVLLGRTELVGTPARLISSNGWELARAAVEFDSATVLRVRREALLPRAIAAERPGATALVQLGAASLDRSALAQCAKAGTMDLAKSQDAPARLVFRDGRSLSAELVRVADELGLRILGEAASQA
ncbi:MAG: hypothetical protein IT454_15220 [Planctomycetes bacterium]|nr:hypothetical protein [Planctomycetota bacterium]